MHYGVVQQGFRRKTYDVILEEKKTRAKELFGEDVNLDSSSPLGKYIQLNAYDESQIWEMSEDVYNSAYINFVSGQALDDLVAKIGISRKKASKSIGTVTFTGDEGTPIDPGTLAETGGENTVRFVTTNTSTLIIDSSGTIDVPIESEEPGLNTVVPSNTITTITNPIPGLDSVTNSSETQGGQDRETDLQLYNRYMDSLRRAGGSSTAAIYANVLNVNGVRAADIIENDSNDTVDGIPPHSFETVVLGGITENVGVAILEKKPAGIRSYGLDEQIVLTDDAGNDKTIRFSRATQVDIYVDVDVTNYNASEFPGDGSDQIKDAIINYIGGLNSENEDLLGLSLGEDVIDKQLINVIMSVPGIIDFNLAFEKTDNPTSSDDIAIASREVAVTSIDKVVVTGV